MKESIVSLWVNGRAMSHELTRRILSLSFTDRIKKADSGRMVLRDPNSELFDTRILKKGQMLHFIVGWVDEALPKGPYIIKSYKMTFPDNGEPSLTVDFQDLSHKLDKKQKKRKHVGTAASILKKIAKEHGLGYDIDSINGLEFTDDFPLNQASYSDATMLQLLADRYGYTWGVSNGNLIFKYPADRQLKKRAEPVVLSYRINDCSIASFDPEIKYSKNGKKTGANKQDDNIDFCADNDEGGGILESFLSKDMSEEDRQALFAEHKNEAEIAVLIEENLGSLLAKNVGEGFRKFYHEAVDSSERLISWAAGTGYQTTNESFNRAESQWYTRQIKKDVDLHTDPSLSDDPDAPQSIYDEVWELENAETTWATPAMLEELARRRKARFSTREVVKAKVTLRLASVGFHPGESVTIAGVGQFLSGDYLIKEVEHTFQRSGMPFKTSLSVARSRLGASKAALQRIVKQEERIRNGRASISGRAEKTYEPELDRVGIVNKVDNA
jgi:phage protein D